MRNRAGTESDSAAGLSAVPWVVTDVRALPHFRLQVRFADGTEGEVDVSELVLSPTAGVFAALRDPVAFAQARVADGAVTWPGGLDLAPDAMHNELREHGRWVVRPFPHASP